MKTTFNNQFQIDPMADINGTCLLQEIRGRHSKVTSILIELFGADAIAPIVATRDEKYSDMVKVTHGITGEVFTIYTCFGQYRVGGSPVAGHKPHAIPSLNPGLSAAARELVALITPPVYLNKTEAIKHARKNVGEISQFGSGFLFESYSERHDAWWQNQCSSYAAAQSRRSGCLIDAARKAMGLEPTEYRGGRWTDYLNA